MRICIQNSAKLALKIMIAQKKNLELITFRTYYNSAVKLVEINVYFFLAPIRTCILPFGFLSIKFSMKRTPLF